MRTRTESRHPSPLSRNPETAFRESPPLARTGRIPLQRSVEGETPARPAVRALRGQDGFDAPVRGQATAPVEVATPVPETRTLPSPVTLNLTASVGARGANQPGDVRQVQDRLQQLGYLSEADHVAEQVDASGTDPISEQAMPHTMDALRRFQREVAGQSDGKISPRGITARALADPTYGTQSTINPGAADATAGLPVSTLPRPVAQIVQAVEAAETGANAVLGESPALLRNASGTPASFGRGQLIGRTALDVLTRHPDAARHYGLDTQQLQDLGNIAQSTREAYRAISAQIPAGGDTEEGLQRRIAEYTSSEQGADFRTRTGLGDADIANMFRAAQLRAQLPRQANSGETYQTLMNRPDVAANIQALDLSESDVSAYLRRPAIHGENREGFITRALLSSEHGQALRDAMTDNGGIPMSRLLIQDNYDQVCAQGAQLLGRPLSAREAAQATMLAHNGPSALNPFFDSLRQGRPAVVTPYVTQAMANWTP
ncbi:peptidoglycan-binding protein [Cystobacter fuscus]|uniref:peptidoglycan-binding protein n=1 Tax=Cystobacter fuscus TaxID=43 RepID=UPI002B2FD327|nr:peptidoglycan-binding protein [Cystobacter fuscus]